MAEPTAARHAEMAEAIAEAEAEDLAQFTRDRQKAFIEFRAEHPRVHCTSCRKRVSIDMDSVNLFEDPVRFHCPHCHHEFSVAK